MIDKLKQPWPSEEGACTVEYTVHYINMGDVEDPDIYAGEPLWNWQQSEAGQWVMANAAETPYWISSVDHVTWGHKYKIMARLSEQNQTYFRLKFNK